MALRSGTRLGPTRSLAALGAGGMGEVYRARDTQLDRDVAIKILPEAFAADAERLARFQREAQVLASLNHPNIAHHPRPGDDADGAHALVMELVEGEDLSQRIARGRDSARRSTADRQADRRGARGRARTGHRPSRSEAGEHQSAARRHGEGARLRTGEAGAGRIRLQAGSSANLSQSPTITTPAMTMAGVILGTAAYMSPEQARGKDGRQARGHLGLRLRAVRNAHRRSARSRATRSATRWRSSSRRNRTGRRCRRRHRPASRDCCVAAWKKNPSNGCATSATRGSTSTRHGAHHNRTAVPCRVRRDGRSGSRGFRRWQWSR